MVTLPNVAGNPLRIWFGILPFKRDGQLRLFLVVEDFGAVPNDAEPCPGWILKRMRNEAASLFER